MSGTVARAWHIQLYYVQTNLFWQIVYIATVKIWNEPNSNKIHLMAIFWWKIPEYHIQIPIKTFNILFPFLLMQKINKYIQQNICMKVFKFGWSHLSLYSLQMHIWWISVYLIQFWRCWDRSIPFENCSFAKTTTLNFIFFFFLN